MIKEFQHLVSVVLSVLAVATVSYTPNPSQALSFSSCFLCTATVLKAASPRICEAVQLKLESFGSESDS